MNTWFILAIFAVLSIFAACISLLMPQKKAPLIDSDNNGGQDTYPQYKTYTAHKKELIRIKNTIAQESRGSEDYFKHKKEQVARVADIYQKWDAKRSILIASLPRIQPPTQESKWNYPGHWPMVIFVLIMLYSVSALWTLWSSSST